MREVYGRHWTVEFTFTETAPNLQGDVFGRVCEVVGPAFHPHEVHVRPDDRAPRELEEDE